MQGTTPVAVKDCTLECFISLAGAIDPWITRTTARDSLRRAWRVF